MSGAKTLQQKPSQFHQKADPVLGSKKRDPFGGPFSMLTLRAIPFPIWNPKKGSIFPPQNWGFFLLFFCCCYCTFAPKGLVDFYSHLQFWQAYSSDSGLLVCCLAAQQQTSVAYWEDTLHVPGLEGGFETHFLEPSKSIVWAQDHVRLMASLDLII